MVYKKYIKRGGKVFGPYYYESYRENGAVKTRFVSGPKKEDIIKEKIKENRNYFIFGFLILVITGIFLLALYYSDEISEKIYSIGLLSPPYGDEMPGDTMISEEDKAVIRREIENSLRNKNIKDIFNENFIWDNLEDRVSNIKVEKISDNELNIYDSRTDKLVATITTEVNKVDISFDLV